tara:strand:- start:44 stop:685 length:642 start_codon:yes stop_codon:yes gene_type:complete
MQVHRLFSVPILQFKLSTHDNYIFNYPKNTLIENQPLNWLSSVNTSFPDAQPDDFITDEQLKNLKKDIHNEILLRFSNLNLNYKFKLSNFWYNIYGNGQGQELHNHLGYLQNEDPIWSGVYYHKNCENTSTVFQRTGMDYRTSIFRGCENSEIGDTFLEHWSPCTSDGDIILFPPYLQHYVKCSLKGNDLRVTFAFNLEDSGTGGTQPPETLS